MKRRFSFALVSLSTLLAFAGCGDDDDSSEDTDKPGTKRDAGPTDAGEQSGEPDSAASSSDAGQEVPGDASDLLTPSGEQIPCGETECQGVLVGGGIGLEVEGCCADKGESSCGLNLEGIGLLLGLKNAGCEPLNLPSSDGADCEQSDPVSVSLPGAPADGIVFEPCCQGSGECGFDANIGGVGFGCVAPERFGQESSGECEFVADE